MNHAVLTQDIVAYSTLNVLDQAVSSNGMEQTATQYAQEEVNYTSA
jgi:hypothetical protein